LRPPKPAAGRIDRALHRYFPQPEHGMGRRLQRCEVPVQAEEYLLRDFIGRVAIVQQMVRNAEHHRPMLAH